MESGLNRTFRVLAETKNEAALEILLLALDSSDADVRAATLDALLDRRDEAGHREVLRRWHTFSDEWKHIVVGRPGRIELAVRAAVLSNDPQLQCNAADLAIHAREYDLIPTLITAAEDRSNPQAGVAAQAVLNLCGRLYDELHSPRDYSNRRDPAIVRQYVYGTLEHAVSRYEPYHPPEILEAFLLLVQPDDAILKQCLRHPHDKIYGAVVGLLTNSSRLPIQRLLLRLFDDVHAPAALAGIWSRRRDAAFLHALFAKTSRGLTPQARANLHKITSFAWLRGESNMLASLNDADLQGAVLVAVTSGMNRLQVFEVVKFALRCGGELSRRAAAAALAEFKGSEANELALATLDDPDPQAQAHAAAQVRERGIPGIMSRLVDLVDSPHEAVRSAVRQALTEFTFQRYLSTFEMLDSGARRSTGTLVKRVDPSAIEQLKVELTSPSRTRRLRAIEVAIAMGAVRDVEQVILDLAADVDHFVRAEAARALIQVPSDAAYAVLRELLSDRSVSVREVAEHSLEQFVHWNPFISMPPPFLADAPPDLPLEFGDNSREALP